MKKSVFFATLALAGLTFKASDAQVRLHIGFNFGTPVYTPAPVADVQYSDADDYYYLPDADAYYCVPEHVYYFMNDNRWVSAPNLPGRFRDFDWRSARRYEIRGRSPFLQHNIYRNRYNGFAGGNPNWRNGDNRFNDGRDGFANRIDMNRQFDRPNPGFDRPERGFNRGNGGFDNGNRGSYNGGYNNVPNQQTQGGFNQRGGGNWDRGNQGQQGGQYNQGQSAPQQGQYNQGGDRNNRSDGQQGGNRNWGGQQQGGPQQGNQYGQPSNNQGGDRGNTSPRQRFADNNGPNYNRQNGMFRTGRMQ